VQGVNPEPPPVEEVDSIEGMEGANKYAFWVCSKIGAEWTKLPNLLPDAIIVGRNINRFFTGDLNALVPSYPPFPGGTEAHLLRTQIAQITAECSISPSGFYVKDDGVDEGIKAIKKAEETKEHTSIDDLKELSSWVHHELLINRNGRCNQPLINEDEGTRPEQELQDLPILGSIAEDEVVDGPAWTISACPGSTGESPDSTVCVKSLKWPGAYAVAFDNKFTNIYCGFGCPSLRGVSHKIPVAPGVQTEWALVDEEVSVLFEEEDRTTRPALNEKTEEEE
jgi:radial spoke head protein 4A